MLSLFASTKLPTDLGTNIVAEFEEDNTKNELFFKQVIHWKNVEEKYISKITQIANNLKEKSLKMHKNEKTRLLSNQQTKQCEKLEQHNPFCASLQLSQMLQLIIDGHKSFLSKVNFDIFMVNQENAEKLLALSKKILEEERLQMRDIQNKKEQIEKIMQKKQKLRRQKQQEQMVQIFISDSFDTTMDQKIRKKGKIKDLQKQIQLYDLKVREVVEEFKAANEKEKDLLVKLKSYNKELAKNKGEILLKMRLHLKTHWSNMLVELNQLSNFQVATCQCFNDHITSLLDKSEDDLIKKVSNDRPGFVENSLHRINQNLIDELIEYSRDRETKNKIKRMMETDEVNPVETDQMSRLVKLIKKVLSQECIVNESINLFKGIINKSSKHRMNFVFVMQFYRLNNQFEMVGTQIYALYCLISQFLQACYENRDSFALKNMMILLMTYYVNHMTLNGETSKIYIIHFFKKNPLWKEIEYWESVLLECIYLEKKNTINAMIVGSSGNLHKKKELLEGQRAAILNQMLIVVRNMIIFEYSEKDVKAFACKFIKLLRQDEKFQKDVSSTIEDAVKEQTKLHTEQQQEIKDFYKLNFDVTKPESYNIPLNVRKSYIEG